MDSYYYSSSEEEMDEHGMFREDYDISGEWLSSEDEKESESEDDYGDLDGFVIPDDDLEEEEEEESDFTSSSSEF